MGDPDQNSELDRFLSDELSEAERSELARRLTEDESLRREYDRLQFVDDLVREARLRDESPARGGGAPEASEDQRATMTELPRSRQRRIRAIVDLVRAEATAERARGCPTKAIGSRIRTVLPWAVAAMLAVVCGVLLYAELSHESQHQAHVSPIDRTLVSHYVEMRKQLGSESLAVIWSGNEAVETGHIHGPSLSAREVVLRVTIIRRIGAESEPWSADVLIQPGHVVELVTQPGRTWPVSVKVSVESSGADRLPITVRAQLAYDPPVSINNHRISVAPGEPESVAIVTAGAYQYEVFVEAVPAAASVTAI